MLIDWIQCQITVPSQIFFCLASCNFLYPFVAIQNFNVTKTNPNVMKATDPHSNVCFCNILSYMQVKLMLSWFLSLLCRLTLLMSNRNVNESISIFLSLQIFFVSSCCYQPPIFTLAINNINVLIQDITKPFCQISIVKANFTVCFLFKVQSNDNKMYQVLLF